MVTKVSRMLYRFSHFNKFGFFSRRFLHRAFTSDSIVSKENYDLKGNLREYCRSHAFGLGVVKAVTFPETDRRPKADIETFYKFSESFSCPDTKWTFRWLTDGSQVLGISSDEVFWKGYEVLEKYLIDETQSLSHREKIALSALERFFSEKEKHENSLCTLKDEKLSETSVASLIAHHFLAQLLPHQTNYYLDKFTKEGTFNGCPCGCDGIIQFGLTSIGSPQLFYGAADIVVFPTERQLFVPGDGNGAAVFTIMRNDQERPYHSIDEDWDQRNGFGDEGITTDEGENDLDEEENDLESWRTWRQLYKQAISLSICKQKTMLNGKRDEISHVSNNACLIPVCGIAAHAYDIVMYDAENDYLLSTVESGELFDGKRLIFSTIVDIWMIIYHSLFCLGPDPKWQSEFRGTCALQRQVGEEKFREIIENSQWFCRIDGPQTKWRDVGALKMLFPPSARYTNRLNKSR